MKNQYVVLVPCVGAHPPDEHDVITDFNVALVVTLEPPSTLAQTRQAIVANRPTDMQRHVKTVRGEKACQVQLMRRHHMHPKGST